MNKVFLLLGGNLGNRFKNIHDAIQAISINIGSVEAESSIYETKAWGNIEQPDFLNIAIRVNTVLSPVEVLKEIQKIETDFGRIRKQKWGERTMDIDILFYNDLVLKTDDLTIPHPLIAMRKFVLLPMAEIATDLIHPISRHSVGEMLLRCEDPLDVLRLDNILY